jgi:hypothetical protein
MEQELPIIVHENEEKTLKIVYRGSDYVYIYFGINNIAVHLGDVEWLIWQLQNI